MDHEFSPPTNEVDFERFCLGLLAEYWPESKPQRWGRRGQAQVGVDIVDMNAAEPLRAAQCKFKKRAGILKSKEVTDEIEQAKAFDLAGLKIGHYVILTPSEHDTALQTEGITTNRKHRRAGLFTVELLTWEAIEEILRGNPGLWETLIGCSMKALIEPIEHQVATVQKQLLVLTAADGPLAGPAAADEVDRRLEAARALLESHEYEATVLLLKNLEASHLSKLDSRQRFLRVTYRAKAALSLGDWMSAGKFFIEAQQHLPNEERAITNAALGLELLELNDEANSAARAAAARFPASPRAWAIIARTAGPEITAQELSDEMPATATSDDEVLVALSMRALHHQAWDEAAGYAAKAAKPDSKWAASWLTLGQAKLQRAVQGAYKTADALAVLDQPGALAEAVKCFDAAVTLAETDRNRFLLVNALIERARAKALSGDEQGQKDDIQKAYQNGHDDPFVLRYYGEYLLISGQIDFAIDILRKATRLGGGADAKFLLGAALREKDADGNRQEWLSLVSDAAAGEISSHAYHALAIALDGMLSGNELDRADALVARVSETGLSRAAVDAGRSRIAMARRNRPDALRLAADAMRRCGATTNVGCRRFVATTLGSLGNHRRALRLWEQVVAETRQISDAWSLMDAAKRAGRHDVILNVAREWREKGIRDQRLMDEELKYLERYEPRRAIDVLQSELQEKPDAPFLLLRLSLLGLRLGRPDLICTDVARLPSPKEAGPHNGFVVVHLLVEKGDRYDAVRYGYRLLRCHPQSEKSHWAFLKAMLSHPQELSQRLLTVPNTVCPGLAVCVIEEGSKAERWYVIEDDGDAVGFGDEIPSDHSFASKLIGRTKGDLFSLGEDVPGATRATLADYQSKYVYRFQRVLEDWQVRFPDTPGFRKFHIEGIGESDGKMPNFLPLIHHLHREQRGVEDVMEQYRSGPMSIHMLARQLGRHDVETQLLLAHGDDGPINCFVGSPQGPDEALQAVGTATACVIDLSAITTLAILGRVDVAMEWPIPLVISTHTLLALDEFLKQWKRHRGGSRIMASSQGLGFQLVKGDPASDDAVVRPFEELREAFNAKSAVQDCPELASARPNARKQLTQILGLHGAESVALAARPGHVLWTDDFAASTFGQHFLSVRSAWTQVVLFDAVRRGVLDGGACQSSSAMLIGHNYYPTRFDVGTLRAACHLADWHIRATPLKHCLQVLAKRQSGAQNHVVTAHFFRSLFCDGVAHIRSDEVALAVLDSLAEAGGSEVVKKLNRSLPLLFRFDIVAESAASALIENWLAIRHGD